MTSAPDDRWLAGDAYEQYMGRWSRPLARRFVEWLAVEPSAHWLEVGCGTGALTSAILAHAQATSVVACDPSEPFVDHARMILSDPRVSFVVASADALPNRDGGFDAVVSGLVLNFLPDPAETVAEFRQRARPGGTVAAYVWDYADGMEFLRVFWDEAAAGDPQAAALHEGRRFPLCHPPVLASTFAAAGLEHVQTDALVVPTVFASFDDYWQPFLRGTGPAPSYASALSPDKRASLHDRLRQRLSTREDAPIQLAARAWAVRGVVASEPG